jgi:O-antigen biosynthesis protein
VAKERLGSISLTYLSEARPGVSVESRVSGAVSVIVPCSGQLEYTRVCVRSLMRHVRPPHELIFVEVGSLDGTPDYLDGIADSAPLRVEVVHENAETRFASAVADGLARTRGEYVAWLSNDTIVTDGWLQQMVALVGAAPELGAVGPLSNLAPGEQQVTDISYRLMSRNLESSIDISVVDRFASEWRTKHLGEWFGVERLGGFCLLFKREALNTVPLIKKGEIDGVFDADAVSHAVRLAGYRLAVCRDLYVHHFGSHLGVW